MERDLIAFANRLSGVFSLGRLRPLNNLPLRTYLPLLKLESLFRIYESIQQASDSQRRRLKNEIPMQVANEIVFRSLVKIPRNFALLGDFLAGYFPEDPLNDSITRILPFETPPLYPSLKDLLDFDLAYLDTLKNLVEVPTQFSDAIQRGLSRFANETYFVNILFAVNKDFPSNKVSLETKQIITEHFVDGFVRQVVTNRQTVKPEMIFDESSRVYELFLTTARIAQEAMIDCLRGDGFIRYQLFEDKQAPLFSHKGSSGGLAFAELYYIAHKSMRSHFAPYTAFVGALNEKREVKAVANLKAKIEAAKENGIRILILPERHRKEVSSHEETDFQFLSYREGGFSDVFAQIQSLRRENGFLPSNNLPERHNRFIGREEEISDIQELLKKERLVTLTGTPGVGKTRLAEVVALELLPSFPDGVWFVDLSSLRDANLVLPTIASVLSIQLQPRLPLQQQMIDFLKTKRLLLVLDNFEQLPSKAGTLIEELIQNTELVQYLVTSRDASACPQGKEFRIEPLDTPQTEAIRLISSVDSVKLFLCRAEESGQLLSEEELTTVAELCILLDGIPFAIELATARLPNLSPKEILSQIKDQRPLQVDEPTDSFDPRHHKLQNVISWSYDLLTETEQNVFAQISVFAGGFFTEAVEKICIGRHVLGNLFNLQAKSLVQTETVQRKKRYFLLEPVRQYAAEKIGDGEQIKKAHADYFCIWAKEQDGKLKGVEQSQVLSEMALELDNFRAAMDFTQKQGEWKLLGELGVAFSLFFNIRCLWSEGLLCLRQAEGGLRSLQDKSLLAKVLYGLGTLYVSQGDYKTAQNMLNESLQIRRELRDKQGSTESLNRLGLIARLQGIYQEARQTLKESLQISIDLEDKLGIATSLDSLGLIAWNQGAYEKARQIHNESLQIYRGIGNKRGIAISLNNLALIVSYQGVYEEAKQFYTESLQILKELGAKRDIGISLNNLGEILRYQGVYEEARQIHTKSLRMRRELGDKFGVATSLNNLGLIAWNQGAYEKARQIHNESLQIYRGIGNKRGIASAIHNLGQVAERQDAYEEAIRFYTESLQMRQELGDKRGIANSLNNLGEIAEKQGSYKKARQLAIESLQIRRELRDKRGIAISLHQFGKLAAVKGNSKQAMLFLLIATRLHEAMISVNSAEAKEVQETLAKIQKEISAEEFEKGKQQADAIGVDEVVERALSWGEQSIL